MKNQTKKSDQILLYLNKNRHSYTYVELTKEFKTWYCNLRKILLKMNKQNLVDIVNKNNRKAVKISLNGIKKAIEIEKHRSL